jgi:hypothetical protein
MRSVGLLDHRQGTEWLPSRVGQLKTEHDISGLVVDGTGPAATLDRTS